MEGRFVEKDIQLGAVPERPFQSRPVSLVSYLCEEKPKDTKITKFPESRSGSNSVPNQGKRTTIKIKGLQLKCHIMFIL